MPKTTKMENPVSDEVSKQRLEERDRLLPMKLGECYEMDFNVRTDSALSKAGIEFVWQLVQKTEKDLRGLKGMDGLNRHGPREVKEALQKVGLGLGQKVEGYFIEPFPGLIDELREELAPIFKKTGGELLGSPEVQVELARRLRIA